MLGKLFNRGPGSNAATPSSVQSVSQKPSSSLESVQEDIHTRNLLFPDAQALFQHRHDQVYPLSSGSALPATSSTNVFDYNGDIELEPRDVRVIIMQDALSSVAASLLYDSQPPPAPPASVDRASSMMASVNLQESRRIPSSARRQSITQPQRPVIVQPDSPQLRQGAFDQRRPSVHSRNQPATESDSQRAWREYREEITTFSSCIFGNSELMAYKGTSTKVHVVPSDPRPSDYGASVVGDGTGSLGRSSMRSSRLSQSFTSERVSQGSAPVTPSSAPRYSERKKVLITRLFPVNLPADGEGAATPQSRFSEDSSGYPFPAAGDDAKKKRKPQLKQKRTPMYAIALVVNLPSSFPSASSASRSGFRGASSFTEQDSSFPSSLSSTRRSGWTMVGQAGQGGGGGGFGLDSFESAISGDIEDRLDVITQHWDVVMRTLTQLQSVVATTIFNMLKQTDLASPDPLSGSVTSFAGHPRASSVSGRRGEDITAMKPPKTNAKNINLLPNCLLENRAIAGEVDTARTRIVSGLRATRVVTGQNRWGIWREEARWVARWADDGQKSFFFNLLTGFLATHTDWLQALAPSSYRKQHYMQQRARGEEEAAVPARTVIVARDKMAARRLIFLLSAFLPATQQNPGLRPPHRPSTSASFGAFSHSPPSYAVPILKEESLRRKINRRTGPGRASHSRNISLQAQPRSSGSPGPLAHLTMEGRHERRSSDTASIRTTHLNLAVGESSGRKSSAATMATITPETSIAHFSTARRSDAFASGRPGSSSSSVATDDLKRLARDDSTGPHGLPTADSRQSSKWGSVISGLWGATRRGSTTATICTQGSGDGRSSSPVKHGARKVEAPSKAAVVTVVCETTHIADNPVVEQQGTSVDAPRTASEEDHPLTPREIAEEVQKRALQQQEVVLKSQRSPDPSGAFESPVKTSINVEDGVIDVDIPFPDYLTSFETAVSSPSSSGFLSTAGFGSGVDAFEQSSRASVDGDVPLNVAGWLQTYHPDFALQAIPAQKDLFDQMKDRSASQRELIEQVKASLRAEQTPPSAYQAFGSDSAERWVDVGSAIVADTTTFTVTRIRYRRLVRPRSIPAERGTPVLSASFPASYASSSLLLTPGLSLHDAQLEDEFHEEVIDSVDGLLVEAVEKVIALSGGGGGGGGADVSKGSSTCSSRSARKRRERSNSESTQSDGPRAAAAAALAVPTEVPRAQCKTVILSALEEVVQQVVESREREGPSPCKQQRKGLEHAEDPDEGDNVLRRAVRTWLEAVEQGDPMSHAA